MTDSIMLGNSQTGVEMNSSPRAQLGTWLRQARELHGLSIDAIAQETKISKIYILGLESGQLEDLPGKVFGRGFVKNITRLLKTDSVEGLRLYDACWGSIETAAKDNKVSEPNAHYEVNKSNLFSGRSNKPGNITFPLTHRSTIGGYLPSRNKRRATSFSGVANLWSKVHLPEWLVRTAVNPQIRMWFLAGAALIFVSLVFGRWAASNIHKSRLSIESAEQKAAAPAVVLKTAQVSSLEHQPVTSVPAATQPMPAASAKSVGSLAVPVPGVVAGNKATADVAKTISPEDDNPLYMASAPTAAFEQVLDLNVLANVEIRITLDGKKVEKSAFTPDSYRFTFNDKAEVYIIDASQVAVSYNGKSLGVLGSKGRKRRVLFQAKAEVSDFPK
jgi:cytoskeletal protein RodZ